MIARNIPELPEAEYIYVDDDFVPGSYRSLPIEQAMLDAGWRWHQCVPCKIEFMCQGVLPCPECGEYDRPT